jgi:hypothetical protein
MFPFLLFIPLLSLHLVFTRAHTGPCRAAAPPGATSSPPSSSTSSTRMPGATCTRMFSAGPSRPASRTWARPATASWTATAWCFQCTAACTGPLRWQTCSTGSSSTTTLSRCGRGHGRRRVCMAGRGLGRGWMAGGGAEGGGHGAKSMRSGGGMAPRGAVLAGRLIWSHSWLVGGPCRVRTTSAWRR